MKASLTSLAPIVAASLAYALAGCSASSSSPPSGPPYPACSASLDVVFTSPGQLDTSSGPQKLVPIGDTLYFFTPTSEAGSTTPSNAVDLQSITPWGEEVTVASYLLPTTGLLSDGTNLHWLTESGLATQVPGGALGEVPSAIARGSLMPTPLTSDDSAIYAIGPVGAGGSVPLLTEGYATSTVTTLASLPGLTSPALYDAGDRVVVVDGLHVYLVAKSDGTVTPEPLPAGVTSVWSADATALYVTGADGVVEKYAYGGALTTLWSSDSLPAMSLAESMTVGADGTFLVSVSMIRDEQFYGLGFEVAEPNGVAAFTACTTVNQGFYAPLITSSAIYGVTSMDTTGSGWQLVEIPR